jgi:hypothetical protein
MPFRLKLARIEAVNNASGPDVAFARIQQVPVADVWECEKLLTTTARLQIQRAWGSSEPEQLLKYAQRDFNSAASFHEEALDAHLPPWADIAAPRNEAYRDYLEWKLKVSDPVGGEPRRHTRISCRDFVDSVDERVCALLGGIMDLLEAPPVLPCNEEALLFWALQLIHLGRLPLQELGGLLDRIIAALPPPSGNSTSTAPGQAIFIALKAGLFARRADPASVILLKNAARAAGDASAAARILDLLSIALSSTGVLRDAAGGVAEYARKLRTKIQRISPFLDDDILWIPVAEKLSRPADQRGGN